MGSRGVQAAMDWLLEHNEDPDIDEPYIAPQGNILGGKWSVTITPLTETGSAFSTASNSVGTRRDRWSDFGSSRPDRTARADVPDRGWDNRRSDRSEFIWDNILLVNRCKDGQINLYELRFHHLYWERKRFHNKILWLDQRSRPFYVVNMSIIKVGTLHGDERTSQCLPNLEIVP